MNNWKKRLYDAYISTGQAAGKVKQEASLALNNYPYYKKLIKEHLPTRKDISIADLACGHGSLIYCLQQFGFQNVKGVDISPEQIKLAHDLGIKGATCLDMSSFLKEQREAFDVVFLMDILEHLEKGELLAFLDQVYDSLRKDAIIIIHVPNAEGLFGMRIRYGDLTHENCFTSRSIEQALNACGFHHVKCFEDKPVIHGAKSLIRRILWELLTASSRLLLTAETGFTHHILSQNMLVVAKKSVATT
jgi:2-polyprenyl-3-methyl-5-hydroxy-6-metoxy-1,4-benzoquinol methylase